MLSLLVPWALYGLFVVGFVVVLVELFFLAEFYIVELSVGVWFGGWGLRRWWYLVGGCCVVLPELACVGGYFF